MEIGALIKVLLEGGFGIAAFVVVLWLLLKEQPENRKVQVARDAAFMAALADAMKRFHDDLQAERDASAAEREKDREARHKMKDAFVALNLNLVERIRCRDFGVPIFPDSPKHSDKHEPNS